jgi:hypothetical protein
MIEPRQALCAFLLADTGVKAAITDIHQGRIPAGAEKPLLLIHPPISRVPQMDLGGVTRKRTRIQITAVADTQTEAEKAAGAVMAAVEGFVGDMSGLNVILATVDNDRQIAYPDIDEIHHHIDVMVTYKG